MKSVETERRWMREERRWLNEASHSKRQRDVLSVKFNTIPRRTVPHTRIKRKLRNLGFDNLEQALQSQIWAFSRQKVTFLTLKRPRSTVTVKSDAAPKCGRRFTSPKYTCAVGAPRLDWGRPLSRKLSPLQSHPQKLLS